jgi:hypothetical protein
MVICLVAAMHPCHNPRLIRKADCLAELGHHVRVVAPWFNSELVRKDEILMARRACCTQGWPDGATHPVSGANRVFRPL